MRLGNKMAQVVFAVSALFFSDAVFAAAKTLIEMSGGQPKAGLAKSWTKVKDGQYDFELDTSAELKKGVNVSPDAVKSSLESKLGATNGVKVTAKGASGVSVTYTGKEADFLDQVSKTKIREKSVEIALESSTSEGGIRAKAADRGANAGEVKGTVVGVAGDVLTIKVSDTKSDLVKAASVVKLKATGFKANDWIFFQPEKDNGGVWTAKANSVVSK